MLVLILGMVLFLGVHSFKIICPTWRTRMRAAHEMAWKASISVVSVIGVGLISWGYGQTRFDPTVLYVSPHWLRHLMSLLMLFSMMAVASVFISSKLTILLKHPTLVATKFWAFSHLLVNGTLADVILFGGFLIWAILDRMAVKRLGEDPTPTPNLSWSIKDALVVGVGMVLTLIFVKWLHLWLIGIQPF